MKRLARIPGLKFWTMLLLFGASLGSCNVLTEEEQDCAVYVRFKYDMNMKFADAFANHNRVSQNINRSDHGSADRWH